MLLTPVLVYANLTSVQVYPKPTPMHVTPGRVYSRLVACSAHKGSGSSTSRTTSERHTGKQNKYTYTVNTVTDRGAEEGIYKRKILRKNDQEKK